jgi:hypothetical protein
MATAIMTETKAEILPISGITFRTYRHRQTKVAVTLRYFVDRNGQHTVCLVDHTDGKSSVARFNKVETARTFWASWAGIIRDGGHVRCEDGRN